MTVAILPGTGGFNMSFPSIRFGVLIFAFLLVSGCESYGEAPQVIVPAEGSVGSAATEAAGGAEVVAEGIVPSKTAGDAAGEQIIDCVGNKIPRGEANQRG